MSSDPILYISLPKDDFADLSNGLYKLNFSRQVDDVATKDPPVWAYKQLDTPTVVTGKSKDTREGIKNYVAYQTPWQLSKKRRSLAQHPGSNSACR